MKTGASEETMVMAARHEISASAPPLQLVLSVNASPTSVEKVARDEQREENREGAVDEE
jgi:hypothetical protein